MKGSIGGPTIYKGKMNILYKPLTPCPVCNSTDNSKGGILILRSGKFGRFLGCSRYPECKYTTTRIKGVKQKPKKESKKLKFRVDRLERLMMKLLKDNNLWDNYE